MADLQNPIMPVVDTSAVTKGLASWAEGRRQAQAFELANQKLIQDAALDQEKMQLSRQQLAQQMEVQNAQIKNYNSESDLRSAQIKNLTETKTEIAKQKQDAMDLVNSFKQDISGIPNTDIGTESGANQLQAIMNNDEYAPIWQLPIARSYAAHADLQQRLGVSRRREDYKVANSSYNQQLTKYGVPPAAMDFLQQDDKGKFQPNDTWNVNDKGNPFMYIAPATTTTPARVVPPAEYQGKVDPTKQPWVPVTLDTPVAKQLLQMKGIVTSYQKKLPLSALQDAHAQQAGEEQAATQQRAAAAGVTTPANPQPGDLYKGYRFIGGDPSNPASWQQAQ